MPQKVREVMTGQPTCLSEDATLLDAAELMRMHNVGDVLIADHDQLRGIVTDRDIVVRGLAEGLDPSSATVRQIATGTVVTVGPDDDVADAVGLMRDNALRRLPVCDQSRLIGVVSLGDLASRRDPESALADISTAPPNN
jgi:CBS domain-containing protein